MLLTRLNYFSALLKVFKMAEEALALEIDKAARSETRIEQSDNTRGQGAGSKAMKTAAGSEQQAAKGGSRTTGLPTGSRQRGSGTGTGVCAINRFDALTALRSSKGQ